jgi:hypothetical protein
MTRDELLNLSVEERVKVRLAAKQPPDDPFKRQVREFLEDLDRAAEVERQRSNGKRT